MNEWITRISGKSISLLSLSYVLVGCWCYYLGRKRVSLFEQLASVGRWLNEKGNLLRRSNIDYRDRVASSIWELIGNTPMVRIESLSQATGCSILGKCEFLNPGGSAKDRVARQMIIDAEQSGSLQWPNRSHIYEATAGNTGISLTLLAHTRHYDCHIFMPQDQAQEKTDILTALGAHVTRVACTTNIADPEHYYNVARKQALTDTNRNDDEQQPKGLFVDQFENLSNYRAHYETTGPEIWRQTRGRMDAIVLAAGTGGSIAGIAHYLKKRQSKILIYLVDPQGSGLHYRIQHGVCYAPQQEEGKRKRRQIDSLTEGIGINRITENFKIALRHLDGSFSSTDREAIAMSRYILYRDGLFLGSGSSTNLVGAARLARLLGPGHTIVTLLTDSGYRHLSKFWNDSVLIDFNLSPSDWNDLSFLDQPTI